MITPEERQQLLDDEHLRLLSIGYFVEGGVHAVMAIFPLFYVLIGLLFVVMGSAVPAKGGEHFPAFLGWFFVAFGCAFSGGFGVLGALQLLTGVRLRQRRSRTLCLVTSGISCVLLPYGTLLGVAAFMILLRPSVEQSFAASASARTSPSTADS
jgi:hypothetical protein